MVDTKPIKEHELPDPRLDSPTGAILYDLTEACFALFGSIISTADSEKPEDSTHPDSSLVSRSKLNIQDLQNSFAQWVDYTGARAPIHVSLDNKLQDHGDIREMIEMLLKMVERNPRRLDSKNRSEAAASSIEAALKRLHLLARVIRKLSVINQDQNLLSFGNDGDNDIRKLAVAFVGWKFPNASPALCEHVGYTLEARRRVLQVNIRRADRRAQKRLEISQKTRASVVAPHEVPNPPPALQGAHRLPVQSVAKTQPTQQSGLDANTFRAFAGSKRLDLATPSIPSTPGEGSGAMTAGYPDPPELKPGDVSVPCPYCKESLSAAQIRRGKGMKSTFWRRHVEDHLQPYGCLFRQCANVWFAREADWTEHMNTVHAANWPRIVQTMAWYCDLNHGSAIDDTPETFFTETAWREHMMNVELHRKYSEQPTPSQPTHSQLETLSIQKQKQAPREKGSCPFCADIPEEIRKSRAPMSLDNDPRLIRHISTHIHSLSFFTFRFLDYTAVPEDEQVSDSSKVSTIQVMLKPRELLTPSERGDDLARVSLTFFDNNDKSVRSSKKDHMYIKERRYIDDDFELDEQDPFTTLRHYVPDDEQEGASWDFLPARKIEIKAVDEAFRTWTSKRLLCHFCDHIRNMDARGLMCPRCNHRFTEVITAENNTTSSQSASTPHLDNRKDVDFRTSLLGRVDWSSNFSNAGDLTVTSQDYLDPEYNPDQHSWHLEPDDESGSWESPPQADVPFTSTDEDLKNWNSRRHLTADEVPRGRDEFHIALICTLPVVYDAILLLLDQAYDDEDLDYGRAPSDPYSYATGCISGHHVVLVLGFQTTTGSLGAGLRSSFKNLKLALTVGICGGVPVIQIADPRKRDLFLGDVVISSQVLQLDFGQHVADAFQIKTDNLPVVEEARSHAIHDLLQNEFKSEVLWASFLEKSMKHLKEIQQKAVEEDYVTHYERPDPLSDIFFAPGNSHMHCNDCAACAASTGLPCGAAHSDSCEELGCDKAENVSSKGRVIARRRQYHPMEGDLRVFHGRIGTAHQVIKSGLTRDKLAAQYELMAFVPEEVASYLEVPHIVVSGVSDYSDSHRPPKAWQAFAAAAAVAVTKTLLQPCKLVDAVVNGVSDHSDSHKSKIWQSYAPATATTVAKELLQTHRLDADDLVTDSAPRSRVVSEAEFSVGKGVMVRKGDKSK